jgi:hypothetical protein
VTTALESPVATVVAQTWHTVLAHLLDVREAHEERGETQGESSRCSWEFVPKNGGVLTLWIMPDEDVVQSELNELNKRVDLHGGHLFLKCDVEGDDPGILASVIASELPRFATPEALERAEEMLNGGAYAPQEDV